MKTIERSFLIAGFLTLSAVTAQGKDISQVNLEGFSLGYTSDWVIKLADRTDKVDLMDIKFNPPRETVPQNGIYIPDTTGLKMRKITPPEVDENIAKKPNG